MPTTCHLCSAIISHPLYIKVSSQTRGWQGRTSPLKAASLSLPGRHLTAGPGGQSLVTEAYAGPGDRMVGPFSSFILPISVGPAAMEIAEGFPPPPPWRDFTLHTNLHQSPTENVNLCLPWEHPAKDLFTSREGENTSIPHSSRSSSRLWMLKLWPGKCLPPEQHRAGHSPMLCGPLCMKHCLKEGCQEKLSC